MAKKKLGSVKAVDELIVSSADLASADVTGVLPTARGGTGTGAPNVGDILTGAAASTWTRRAIGTAGQVPVVNGGATDWAWDTPPFLPIVGGTLTGALVVDGSVDTVTLTVKGHVGQTAHLQTWTDSADVIKGYMTAAGALKVAAFAANEWYDGTFSKQLFTYNSGGSYIQAGDSSTPFFLPGYVGIGQLPSGTPLHLKNWDAAFIGQIIKGAAGQTANLQEWQNSGGTVLSSVDKDGGILSANRIVSAGSAGVGYATGAGGTVVQATNKTTGVTLNTITGRITMNGAALAAGSEATFVVTNSTVALSDVIIVNHVSGGTAGAYLVSVSAVAAGSFTITVSNCSGGSLSEAVEIGFAIIKGATS